jgi:hypothetical protein
MNILESNVLTRAKEWYLAKKAAEENAGQPVNWCSFNLDRLEEAVSELIKYPEPIYYGLESGII